MLRRTFLSCGMALAVPTVSFTTLLPQPAYAFDLASLSTLNSFASKLFGSSSSNQAEMLNTKILVEVQRSVGAISNQVEGLSIALLISMRQVAEAKEKISLAIESLPHDDRELELLGAMKALPLLVLDKDEAALKNNSLIEDKLSDISAQREALSGQGTQYAITFAALSRAEVSGYRLIGADMAAKTVARQYLRIFDEYLGEVAGKSVVVQRKHLQDARELDLARLVSIIANGNSPVPVQTNRKDPDAGASFGDVDANATVSPVPTLPRFETSNLEELESIIVGRKFASQRFIEWSPFSLTHYNTPHCPLSMWLPLEERADVRGFGQVQFDGFRLFTGVAPARFSQAFYAGTPKPECVNGFDNFSYSDAIIERFKEKAGVAPKTEKSGIFTGATDPGYRSRRKAIRRWFELSAVMSIAELPIEFDQTENVATAQRKWEPPVKSVLQIGVETSVTEQINANRAFLAGKNGAANLEEMRLQYVGRNDLPAPEGEQWRTFDHDIDPHDPVKLAMLEEQRGDPSQINRISQISDEIRLRNGLASKDFARRNLLIEHYLGGVQSEIARLSERINELSVACTYMETVEKILEESREYCQAHVDS